MTTHEAAEALGVSVRRVQAMIKSGRLKAQKIGRDYHVTEADVDAVRERHPGRPSGKKDACAAG